MALVVLVYVLVAVPFAFLTAHKARRLGQSWGAWFVVALCVPVISLAVVTYFEPDRRRA